MGNKLQRFGAAQALLDGDWAANAIVLLGGSVHSHSLLLQL